MKILTVCLLSILAIFCTTSYRENMIGDWVSVMDKNIRLQVKNDGKNLAVRYYYPDFLIDNSGIDSQGRAIIDTLTAPHTGEWMKAYYNYKRGVLIGMDHPQVSYDPGNDALVRVNTSNEVRVFGRVR
jgi:hypothetical protein